MNNLKEIEEAILKDEMTPLDIIALKKQLESLSSAINEKSKPKTITISSDVHSVMKDFCNKMGYNIGDFTEKAILDKIELDKSNEVLIFNKKLSSKHIAEKKELLAMIDVNIDCIDYDAMSKRRENANYDMDEIIEKYKNYQANPDFMTVEETDEVNDLGEKKIIFKTNKWEV